MPQWKGSMSFQWRAAMDGEQEPCGDDSRAGKEKRFRDDLLTVYGVRSKFLRVSTLSQILGIGAPTIYAAMRQNRFCLPHRYVGASPLVSTDDLVNWYCDPSREKNVDQKEASGHLVPAEKGPPLLLSRASAKQALAKDMRAEVIACVKKRMQASCG
ncbi:hypothetical protein JOE11_005192 [Robbsia andropogonis]|uniref:hypothetical protein n=1 Tax=Robbsia andropogonis TaxID=28092 RepID=UPI003D2407EE